MSLNAEDLIPKVARLVAVSRQRAIDFPKVADISNQLNAILDAGATDNLQPVIDSISAEIDAQIAEAAQ